MANRVYKIEISVVVDESKRQRLIDTAREFYARSGGVTQLSDDETEVPLPAEECVETVDDALMELLQQHPGFEQAGIEIQGITCDTEEDPSLTVPYEASAGEIEATVLDDSEEDFEDADELDAFETGVYLCRWPNGDSSVVTAESHR